MTARQMIEALLAYDLDTPLYVGKGMGPASSIEPWINPAGEVTLIIRPVTPGAGTQPGPGPENDTAP